MIPRRRGTTVYAVGRPFGVGERSSGGELSDRISSLSLFLSGHRAYLLPSSPSPVAPSPCRTTRSSHTLPASRRVPLNARCAVMHRAGGGGGGIASASHKVCSCREYELPLPNQYHSSKKRGKKERGKKRRLGTYNCRTSAITVSALCPRSCRRSPPTREHRRRRRRLLPLPSLPPPPPPLRFSAVSSATSSTSRVPTPYLAWG